MSYSQDKRHSIEANPEMTQKLELANQNFKAAAIIILKGLKENVCNESHQIQNLTREIETIKESNGNSWPKNSIAEIFKWTR